MIIFLKNTKAKYYKKYKPDLKDIDVKVKVNINIRKKGNLIKVIKR